MVFFPDSEYQNRSKMSQTTIEKLEAFRADLGWPTRLTADASQSGHAIKSLHYYDDKRGILAKAVDGTNEAPLWDFITKAIKAGFTGIGIYLQNGKVRYFHLDDRETTPTFWVCEVDKNNYIYKMGDK